MNCTARGVGLSRRISLVAAVFTAAVITVVACGESRPDAAGLGAQNQPPGNVCATPHEGCPCTVGEQAPCAYKIQGDDSFLWCAEGFRSCESGTWGTCVTDGNVSIRSNAFPSLAAQSLGGSIHVQALGTPRACNDYDAGADSGSVPDLDPCDPYCNVTSDTPIGFDAGPGFTLSDGGLVVAGCGDGQLRGSEECDDGNSKSGDGCSDQCLLEVGFQCPTPGSPCTATTCGNGAREGAEECDDGNLRPYDGCSPTCQREVQCPGGACVALCGDGLKFPSEACDDGNLRDGDGCSSTCTVEPNATCTTTIADLPSSLTVPVIYRDFTPATHPDFESYCCGRTANIPKFLLGADGKPELNATQGMVQSATSFYDWYHDTAKNITIPGTLTLNRQPDNSYVFDSNNFFPLNGQGFGNYGTTGKNFHFTSELRYPFTYNGGEVLSFTGDDDVWVYINGRLAVDIGGVHGAESGTVTLNAATAATLGNMVVGNSYEIVVFQAERHTTQSNYRLTLRGFVRARSVCKVPSDTVVVRDFEAVCAAGSRPVWQLFRWRASVPGNARIDFRAATADTQAALPAMPDPAPTTVPIGTAEPTNSPPGPTPQWRNDTGGSPPVPVPVSKHLKDEGNTSSKQWLRVFMTFVTNNNNSPRLDEWQQLYSCVPSE
jgi:fibro-slime domain-containing protein